MKWFSLFWASYLVILSCIPCTHHHDLRMITDRETIFHHASHDDENGHDENENEHHHVCSPFCQCTCNGGFTVPTPDFELQIISLICSAQTLVFSNQSSYTPSLFATIWQPPKLPVQG